MKISFTGVVLLLTFVLSLFSGSLAYADHYSKEFIESQKQLIKAAFASVTITEEDYHAKLESFMWSITIMILLEQLAKVKSIKKK